MPAPVAVPSGIGIAAIARSAVKIDEVVVDLHYYSLGSLNDLRFHILTGFKEAYWASL